MLFAFGFVVSFFVVAIARCSCSILISAPTNALRNRRHSAPQNANSEYKETSGVKPQDWQAAVVQLSWHHWMQADFVYIVNIWSTWMNIKLQYNPRTFHLCTPIRRLTRRYECLYWTFRLTGVHCWQPLAQSTAEGLAGGSSLAVWHGFIWNSMQQTRPVFKGQMVLAIATAQIFRRSCTHIFKLESHTHTQSASLQ